MIKVIAMGKSSPFFDALAAGTALDAIVDKDDPKRDSKIFTAGVVAFARSAFANDRIESEARRAEFRQSLDSFNADTSLQGENDDLRRKIATLQHQQHRAAEDEETRRKQLVAVRKFIITASEGEIANLTNKYDLAIIWFWSKLIADHYDPSILGLDEMRALAQIDAEIAKQETNLDSNSSRLVAAAKGLLESVTTWNRLITRQPETLRQEKIDRCLNDYERRRAAAFRVGLVTNADTSEPIQTVEGVRNLFVVICQLSQSGGSMSVDSIEGTRPFGEVELQDLRQTINDAKAIQRSETVNSQQSHEVTLPSQLVDRPQKSRLPNKSKQIISATIGVGGALAWIYSVEEIDFGPFVTLIVICTLLAAIVFYSFKGIRSLFGKK